MKLQSKNIGLLSVKYFIEITVSFALVSLICKGFPQVIPQIRSRISKGQLYQILRGISRQAGFKHSYFSEAVAIKHFKQRNAPSSPIENHA